MTSYKNCDCFALRAMVTKQSPWLAKHESKRNSKTKQPIVTLFRGVYVRTIGTKNEAGCLNWLPWWPGRSQLGYFVTYFKNETFVSENLFIIL